MQEIWYEFQGVVFGRNPDTLNTIAAHNLTPASAYLRARGFHPLDTGQGVPPGTPLKSVPFRDLFLWRKLESGQEIDFLTTYDLWEVFESLAPQGHQNERVAVETGARFELEIEVVGPTHDGQVRSAGVTRVITVRVIGPKGKNGEWQKAT